MKKYKQLTLIVCVLYSSLSIFSLISCSDKFKSDSFIEISLDLNKSSDSLHISNIFSKVYPVKLESREQIMIGKIDKIVLYEDEIFISTGTRILVFCDNGSYIRSFSNYGKGPGEYTEISDFLLDENTNTIEILDANQQKVIVYDMNFNHLSDFIIGRRPMRMAISRSGKRLFHHGNEITGQIIPQLTVFKDGEKIGEYKNIDINRSLYLHIQQNDCMSYYNDFVNVTDAHNDTVYSYDGKGLYPKYVFHIGKKGVPKSLYERTYSNILDFNNSILLGKGYAFGIFGFIETDRNLYLRYNELVEHEGARFGKRLTYHVLYNKLNGNINISKAIMDDINFKEPVKLNNSTTFFSQPNGKVVYHMDSHDFLGLFTDVLDSSDPKDSFKEKMHPEIWNIYKKTKVLDNPIIWIAQY